MFMSIIVSFVVSGLICAGGQLIIDVFKQTPAFMLSLFIVIGSVLDGLGLYEPFIDFAGATVPIMSFGNDLVHGALAEAEQSGIIGVVIGMFQLTSAGITSAIVFGIIGAFLFNPKS